MASTPSTAVDRVFGTFELLEHILLNVAQVDFHTPFPDGAISLRTVLLSQRVSRLFQSTIANSSPLQQALHFGPAPKKPDHFKLTAMVSQSPTNHLLEHTFYVGDTFIYGYEWDYQNRRLPGAKAKRPWQRNAKYRDSKKNEVPVHGEESWRRMRLFTYYEHYGCADH